MERMEEFRLEEEDDERIRKFAKEKKVCLLCIIAPFIPERVAPGKSVYAEFRYPEEFIIEEFVTLVKDTYPNKAAP